MHLRRTALMILLAIARMLLCRQFVFLLIHNLFVLARMFLVIHRKITVIKMPINFKIQPSVL
jgi:hypothetical protein